MNRRTFVATGLTGIASVVACALGITPRSALASTDAWPTKQINYVIAFAPGSNTDVLGRIMAQQLGELLKKNVVVENRAGATGMIGSAYVAKAPPDGYTLLGASIASHAINPSLFKDMQYDPVASFQPITIIGMNANTLVVSNESRFKSVQDIIQAAREKPGTISYASSGIGTTQHLSGVLLEKLAGIKLVHAPYSGRSAIPDVIGQQVDFMFEGPTVVPQVKGGRLRALAVTSPDRLKSLPDVPTMQEAGVKDYEVQAWQAIFAPAGTPRPIVDKLHQAFTQIINSPETRTRLEGMGVLPSAMSPDDFAVFQKKEIAKWGDLVSSTGVKVE